MPVGDRIDRTGPTEPSRRVEHPAGDGHRIRGCSDDDQLLGREQMLEREAADRLGHPLAGSKAGSRWVDESPGPATRTRVPITIDSGSTPDIRTITRGPSSSSTSATTYGISSANCGLGARRTTVKLYTWPVPAAVDQLTLGCWQDAQCERG